jgi:hypothetical protein
MMPLAMLFIAEHGDVLLDELGQDEIGEATIMRILLNQWPKGSNLVPRSGR